MRQKYETPDYSSFKNRGGMLSQKVVKELNRVAEDLKARPFFSTTEITGGKNGDQAAAWQNPEDCPIIVTRVLVHIKTPSENKTTVLQVQAGDQIHKVPGNTSGLYDSQANGGAAIILDAPGGNVDTIDAEITLAGADDMTGTLYVEYIQVA
jgi:hypothetical protein